MLVQQGTSRDNKGDLQLACLLAAVAGALNAAAFSAVGFFSANMTGNLSALSDKLALGQWQAGGFYFLIILAFIVGATASTLSINIGHRRGVRGIFAINILIEAGLLLWVGGCDIWLGAPWRIPAVVLGLSFLMGFQNAVVTRISDARVRTTHISGMATDIGIELGLLIDIMRGASSGDDSGAIGARLRLHLETILSFFVGGVAGVLMYRSVGGILLWITSAALMLIAFPTLLRTQAPQPWHTDRPEPPNDL